MFCKLFVTMLAALKLYQTSIGCIEMLITSRNNNNYDMLLRLPSSQPEIKIIDLEIFHYLGQWLYCPFNIFWKVVFCLLLYTEEVNLQNFDRI